MENARELFGLIIALIAVTGGLTIGIIAVKVSVEQDMKQRLAKIEARAKERLALIEKGLDPGLADKDKRSHVHGPLLWGLLLFTVGPGLIIGYLISMEFNFSVPIMMNGMALLFGGIGLLIYYWIKGRAAAKQA